MGRAVRRIYETKKLSSINLQRNSFEEVFQDLRFSSWLIIFRGSAQFSSQTSPENGILFVFRREKNAAGGHHNFNNHTINNDNNDHDDNDDNGNDAINNGTINNDNDDGIIINDNNDNDNGDNGNDNDNTLRDNRCRI